MSSMFLLLNKDDEESNICAGKGALNVADNIDKSIGIKSGDDTMEDAYFDWNRILIQPQSEDIEGCSEDIEITTLDALIEAVDDYSSSIPEFAQAKLDVIIEGVAAPVDELPLKVINPSEKIMNQHSISDSQIPQDFPNVVVAAHQAAKNPTKRTRTKSKVFKSPYLIKFPFDSKIVEDQTVEMKQKFAFNDFIISDNMSRDVIEEYKQWVDEDTVLSSQHDYAQSIVVAQNKEAIRNIIKKFCISTGLPWHLVDGVYVPLNYNKKFHWVLVIIALKDRRIRVYDSLSKLRNMKSSVEIHKFVVMLSTYLSDSEFFKETSRTNWKNLEAYRDKMSQRTQLVNQHSFEVEYVQNIMQQECDSLYVEYLSEGIDVPSINFEAEYHRMRYASLLLNYGIHKAKKCYAREDCAKSFKDTDFDSFSEKDNNNDLVGPSIEKDVQVIETSQIKASRKIKHSFEVQDVVGDISIKFGEVATAIDRMVDSRLDVTKLYEEVMVMKGYNEEFLGDAFDYLVQSDTLAKAFMVKNQNLRKNLDQFSADENKDAVRAFELSLQESKGKETYTGGEGQ
ncbi:hypothetical protein FXO38_33091 [Capsicum annuum]|nr:hypothetical protein FXO38_33091 [Capsicum annuum]